MDELTDVGLNNGWMNRCIDIHLDQRRYRHTDREKDRQKILDRRTDRQIDEQMDREKDK